MLSHSFLSFTFESSLVLPVFYSWLKQNGVTLRRNIFYLNSIHTFRTWLLIQQDGPISLLSKCIPNNHWLEISPTNQIAYPSLAIGRLDVYWLTDSTTYRWLVCFKQCYGSGSGSGRIRSFLPPLNFLWRSFGDIPMNDGHWNNSWGLALPETQLSALKTN